MPSALRVVVAEGVTLGVLIVAALADTIPIGASPRWVLLTVHVACACILIGGAATGALSLALADRSADSAVRAFVSRVTMLTDAVFTGPACLGLVLTGAGLASVHGGLLRLPWGAASLAAFGAAGLGWLVVLVPLQEALCRAADAGDRARWERIARLYPIPGTAMGALLLVTLGLMIAKPSL